MRFSFLLKLLLLVQGPAFCFSDSEQTSLVDILCPEESQYNPTYMICHKSHFGYRQHDYLKRSRDLILKTKKSIQDAVKSKQDLSALFFDLLSLLAKERKQIAFDHETPAAKEFGVRRDSEGLSDLAYTYFAAGYQEYGDRILILLKGLLSQMQRDQKRFIQKKYFAKSCALGCESSIELEVFENEDLKRTNWFVPFAGTTMPDYFPQELINKRELSPEEEVQVFQALTRLRKEEPGIHDRVSKSTLFMEMQRDCLSPIKVGQTEELATWVGNPAYFKSLYVIATTSFKINGKHLPLYQYVTWLYRDPEHPEEDLLDRMVKNSIVTVIHQYHWHLPEMLQEMASAFQKAVLWDRRDLFELKKLMALFRYGLVCMPFARGTAAITEWLEAALYEYHGVQFQCDRDRMIDLEAYVHPFFSDFLEVYNSMYNLQFQLCN